TDSRRSSTRATASDANPGDPEDRTSGRPRKECVDADRWLSATGNEGTAPFLRATSAMDRGGLSSSLATKPDAHKYGLRVRHPPLDPGDNTRGRTIQPLSNSDP